MKPAADFLIVGGGLVGAAAALSLARRGRSVTVVDRARPVPMAGELGMDIRNIACSPASRSLLEGLGVWPETAAPYERMVVWEDEGTAELAFDAREVGVDALGWILENSPLLEALWAALDREAAVRIVLGDVDAVTVGPEWAVVVAADEELHGRLLIGVDGARSRVRQDLGVGVETMATGHVALATVVRTERPHAGVAHQRFLKDGPLALLPSRFADRVSVVWSQSPDEASRRQALATDAFMAELADASEHRLGRILAVDRRLTFPLSQQVVADFNPDPRVLLIGDAARVLHPLAGLGANAGFEDVRALLAVVDRLPIATDPGSAGLWRSYARRRRHRARQLVMAMSVFRNGYAWQGPLANLLRNTAIRTLNEARPLKAQIMREAMGLGPLASTVH